MNHKRRNCASTTIAIIAVLIVGANISNNKALVNIKDMLAGVFFVNSTSTEYLMSRFQKADNKGDKIKILVVPGHDDGSGGTRFLTLKERDLNIQIAEALTNLLRQENKFEVILTRNEKQYNENIQKYILENVDEIKRFSDEHKNTMRNFVASGIIDTRESVEHITAPSETILRLYGINKWANENGIDIVLHLHFNDYPRANSGVPGKYSGSAIYIPEKQYSNAKASKEIAEKVFARLTRYGAKSDMPLEALGIIESQKLIAIGAYNTLDPAVLLIEYGYIYEPQFVNEDTRELALNELAMQTYLGILDFFNDKETEEMVDYTSAVLPYFLDKNLGTSVYEMKDTFALQTILAQQSFYPPLGKSKNDCPVSGHFGPCTKQAVIDFQKENDIEPAVGFVGPLTRGKLNDLFVE